MTVRLAPALVITEEEIGQSVEIIEKATRELEKLNEERANKSSH